MADPFYVYVHRRADTGLPFYVGKGKGDRARSRQGRNAWWLAIVAKHGEPTIHVAATGLHEELAHLAEVELIDQYRRRGLKLVNLTDGGEGMSGYAVPADVLARRAASQRGQKRPSVSASLKGRAKSEEHRRKLSEAKIGKRMSEAARAAMSEGQRRARPRKPKQLDMFIRFGRKDSDETRAKKSAARQGSRNPRFGVPIPPDQKARQIAALAARPRLICPHCATPATEGNAKRWHFANCKGVK